MSKNPRVRVRFWLPLAATLLAPAALSAQIGEPAGQPLGEPAGQPLGEPAKGPAARAARRDPPTASGGLLGRPAALDFSRAQLDFPRVRMAWISQAARVDALFARQGLDPSRAEVYLRAFKQERLLEVWAREAGRGPFVRLATYPVCAVSGALGPKRRQGDEQVPEGFYHISAFNPWSAYHLSLELNYPNRADRLRERDGAPLGGDIFIHGDCRTVGCLPMTDAGIEEIYWIAVLARAAGQDRIPVHIFPARMEGESLRKLLSASAGNPALRAFWEQLRPGYEYFQALRRVPDVSVTGEGRYEVDPPLGFPLGVLEESWKFLPRG